MVHRHLSDDVVPQSEPNEWVTFRWTDEFGNSIAPFFTNLGSGQQFLKEMHGWQLKRYPVSLVVEVILPERWPRLPIRTDLLRSAGEASREIEGNHERTDHASAKVAAVLIADAAHSNDSCCACG